MKCWIALLLALCGRGQAQDQTIENLELLVGKQVIVQRTPLCQPGTYTAVLTYAGKQATVVSLKPSKIASLPRSTMNRLPPETRAMLEDRQKGATVLLQFEDGTTLDSCGPVTPRSLPNYFELVPGQKLEPIPAVATPAPSALPAQQCPVSVVKAASTNGGLRHALADGLTKSEFERAVDRARQGGHDPHYLDVRMRNDSQKSVRAIEAFVVYSDNMGDPGARETILSQNDKSISPGGEHKGYMVDTAERWRNGMGDVTVYVNRVRFEDNVFWQDNGSHSCALTTRVKP